MEKQTLFMALAGLLLIVSFFQALQIGGIAGRLEKLQAASVAIAAGASGGQLAAAPAASGGAPIAANNLNGYASQVGGC